MSLAHRYKQSYDYRWKASQEIEGELLPTVTSSRACLAISAYWIIKKQKGEDFWDWLGASKVAMSSAEKTSTNYKDHLSKAGSVASDIKSTMATQKLAISQSNPLLADVAKFQFVSQLIAQRTGMKILCDEDGLTQQFLGRDYSKYAKKLNETPGFKYISFGGYTKRTQSGTLQHGIAAFTAKSEYRLFDPNIGEFVDDTLDALSEDMIALMKYYDIRVDSAYFAAFSGPG